MKNETKRTAYAWMPVLVYAVLIFVQSSFPSPEFVPKFDGADKVLHFFGYGLMGLLFLRGFRISDGRIGGREILWSIVFTSLYGMSDEFHQYFVVGRTADVRDALADTLGGACGVYLFWMLDRAGILARRKGKT